MAITRAQVLIDSYDHTVVKPSSAKSLAPDKAERMIKHDALAIAAAFAVAPIVDSPWAVDADVPEHGQWIEEQLFPHRTKFITHAMYGEIIYGYSCWELVFTVEGGLDDIKWLKPQLTWVQRHIDTGAFEGLKVIDLHTGRLYYLPPEFSLFVSSDPAGGYAIPRLANAEAAFDAHQDAAESAARFTRKMAGALPILDYTSGETPVKHNGVVTDMDNQEVAQSILDRMRSASGIAMPQEYRLLQDKPVRSFDIRLLESQAAQADMTVMLKYNDERMTRALLVPSRAVNEGSFGTKAESEAQATVALQCMELRSAELVEVMNKYVVPRLLMMRFGVDDTVRLCNTPLDDEAQARYMKLLEAILTGAPELAARIDWEEMAKTLDLPMLPEGADPIFQYQPPVMPNQQPPQPNA